MTVAMIRSNRVVPDPIPTEDQEPPDTGNQDIEPDEDHTGRLMTQQNQQKGRRENRCSGEIQSTN